MLVEASEHFEEILQLDSIGKSWLHSTIISVSDSSLYKDVCLGPLSKELENISFGSEFSNDRRTTISPASEFRWRFLNSGSYKNGLRKVLWVEVKSKNRVKLERSSLSRVGRKGSRHRAKLVFERSLTKESFEVTLSSKNWLVAN